MNIVKVFKSVSLLMLTVGSIHTAIAKDIEVDFTNEKVEVALNRASNEGKLVFLDFYASWCTPCKWMEKTTFKNPAVVEAMSESFIPVKVNIDDAAGFELKNKYEINYLPTMLIINSKGQLVERVEEPLTADNLVSLLKLHDHDDNKVMIKHNFNTSPKNMDQENGPELDPWKISKEDYRRYVDSEEKRNFKVQIGIYTDYKTVRNKVSDLRKTFFEPVVVVNDYRDGKVLFKIMLGQFETLSEAESFRLILKKDFNMDGIIH